jgi:AcrR family transcriptional regulator
MDLEPAPGDESSALSQDRRRKILAGAGRIFMAEGYEGASMSQIAAAADVSKGTLYNYYPSKKDLFAAFVAAGCSQLVTEMFSVQASPESPAETLTRIGRLMLTTMVTQKGLAMFRMVVMEAAKFPELAQLFIKAGPETLVNHLAAWLRTQAASGQMRVADPYFAAEQFFALAQTRLVLRARVDPAYQASDADIDFVVQGAVEMFFAAYGPN